MALPAQIQAQRDNVDKLIAGLTSSEDQEQEH
jgi:hypothetical protein